MGIPVNFKRGTQQALDSMLSLNATTAQFKEGTFYLTNDTNRLYFAQADNRLVDLNQYIHIWEGSNPPTTSLVNSLKSGDIYYLQGSNILAICDNPSTGTWVQLNPDTYLEVNNSNITLSSSGNSITISDLISDSKGNESQGSFTLTGGSNVTLTREGNTITIASTDTNDNYTYGLATTTGNNQANLVLNAAGGGTTSSVVIRGGGSVSVSSNANGEITVAGSGGVSDITHTIDSNGAFSTTLATSDGDLDSNSLTPTIVYGATNAPASAVFANGTANLEVYTRALVDSLISDAQAAANAMQYKGTVSLDNASTKLASTGNVGDTYKAEEAFTYGGMNINTGDLLIAEGSDGNVTWSLIPSGDDLVISGSVSGNTVSVEDLNSTLASLTVNGSTSNYGNINVTSTSSGSALTLTVSHGDHGTGSAVSYAAVATTTTQELETNIDIPTITGISLDQAGHVTSVTASTYRLKDTHANIKSVSITSAATDNIATVTVEVEDTDNVSQPAQFRIKSNNLEVTSTSSENAYNVNVDFVWGSF